MVWAFSFSTMEVQCVYYIELNKQVGLLHTDEQRGGRGYSIQLNQGDMLS